jgi:biotin carboxylase
VLADEAVCMAPIEPALHCLPIVSAALITGADAIHPGTLSPEYHYFAEICAFLRRHLRRAGAGDDGAVGR